MAVRVSEVEGDSPGGCACVHFLFLAARIKSGQRTV